MAVTSGGPCRRHHADDCIRCGECWYLRGHICWACGAAVAALLGGWSHACVKLKPPNSHQSRRPLHMQFNLHAAALSALGPYSRCVVLAVGGCRDSGGQLRSALRLTPITATFGTIGTCSVGYMWEGTDVLGLQCTILFHQQTKHKHRTCLVLEQKKTDRSIINRQHQRRAETNPTQPYGVRRHTNALHASRTAKSLPVPELRVRQHTVQSIGVVTL